MDSKLRWRILLGTAALTAGASFYPTTDANVSHVVAANKRLSTPVLKTDGVAGDALAAAAEVDLDPFAPRGWQAPPPPPPPAPVATAQVAIAPAAPVGPPPLPFKFMGSIDDDGNQVIYLSRGEQSFIARSGEKLDDIYKVLGMNAQRIEFEHIPTGEKQTLAIPASEN